MRYELQSKSVSAKTNVYDVENIPAKTDKEGKEIEPAKTVETKTNRHAYSVTLTLIDTESLNSSPFNTSIIVEVNENTAMKWVDAEIEAKVNEYLKSIN
jgi:hypothetical protein